MDIGEESCTGGGKGVSSPIELVMPILLKVGNIFIFHDDGLTKFTWR